MGKPFSCGLRIQHFEPEEFYCPCCGEEEMHQSTLLKIEQLRIQYGKPLTIPQGGGWRCEDYSSSPTSAHAEGRAADFSYPRADHDTLLGLGYSIGFTGKGNNNRKIDGQYRWQLHLDDADEIPGVRPRPFKWTY